MKRIRQDFDLNEDSWGRIAKSVGVESPVPKGAQAIEHLTETPIDEIAEDEVDLKVLEMMNYIYGELEEMPEGMGPIILTRIVEDLALQPGVQLVTARRDQAEE